MMESVGKRSRRAGDTRTRRWLVLGAALLAWSLPARAWPAQEERLGPEAFANLLKTLYEPYRSISFVYEGEQEKHGAALRSAREAERIAGRTRFQGVYAYKQNGSIFLDVFNEPLDNDRAFMTHRTVARTKEGRLESNRTIPDRDGVDGEPQVRAEEGASVWEVFAEHSPRSLFQIPWLSVFLDDPQRWQYEFLGWEAIDDRRCLNVRFSFVPNAKDPTYSVYWFDLERGGHPVRYETHKEGRVASRTTILAFREYHVGDESFWLPVSARSEGYSWNGQWYRRPVVASTYALVRGSVWINEEIPDELFHAERVNGISPIYQTLGLARVDNPLTLDETAADLAAQAPDPSERAVGPAGVAERLDRMLEEAERQAELLEASSPARPAQVATRWTSIGLVAFGFVAIAAAVAWKFRIG